jgi:transcription-repair coupling factor (superfamily II helicase)
MAVSRISGDFVSVCARLTPVRLLPTPFEDELQDRFGPLPAALSVLPAQARLAALARAAGIGEVSAGPKGVALTFVASPEGRCLKAIASFAPGSELKGGRLVVPVASVTGAERVALIEKLLVALAA